jgi:hydroxymethylbilane synthase
MIRLGARNSPLARSQADQVADALRAEGVDSRFVPIRTQGDVDRRELVQIGGTGVFTAAVRDALLEDRIDLAVHSCKDLPTAPVEGLETVAHPAREDTRDVLVGLRLDQLPTDRPVVVGTGAPRRVVQLEQLAAERDIELTCKPIRGNVGTRLQLVRDGAVDAVVLAAAGLRRLGLLVAEDDVVQPLEIDGLPAELLGEDLMLPAPGQAALALEIASSLDSEIRRALTRLDDAVTRAEVLAERRFLAVLEAGCTAPVGARARVASHPSADRPGTDLTLVAVLGRTGEIEDRMQHTNTRLGTSAGPLAGADQVIGRGGLVQVSGHGSTADPVELGARLAELTLTRIDLADFPR